MVYKHDFDPHGPGKAPSDKRQPKGDTGRISLPATQLRLEQAREIVIEEEQLPKLFTGDEIVSLLWLRQAYQTGRSDRASVLCHWEFLKLLVTSGRLEL